MTAWFWIACGLLAYTYLVYPLAVWLWAAAKGRPSGAPAPDPPPFRPSLRVIVAAHNEEAVIERRLEDLLAQDYPPERLAVTVISDGSSDRTVPLALRYGERGVTVLARERQCGRAACHNYAIGQATEDILVFTDADTLFDRQFLRCIAAPFADARVGCVTGRLSYLNTGASGVTASAGLYWRLELWLRRMESRAGCLAVASGACMAVRRALVRPLLGCDDIDFTTPLDVVWAGYRVVHEERALAYDSMPSSPRGEFRARIRMVAKNLPGTLHRLRRGSLLRHPGVIAAVISHKLLRWLTPLLLALALAANLFLAGAGMLYRVTLILQAAFYSAALVGWLADRLRFRFPLTSGAFGFALVNLAFLFGIAKALFARPVSAYRSQE